MTISLRTAVTLACSCALAAAVLLPGLDWGLPSSERAEIVLPAAQRTDAFLARLGSARQAIYTRAGGNPNAELGELNAKGQSLYPSTFDIPPDLLLLSYSGFLLRSRDPDEQRTLAALAQIRPGKLQFNPHYFVYGGLYVYSMGAWLLTCRLAHLITLVPDVAYYYRNPDAMRAVYLAGRLYTVVLGGLALACLAYLGRKLCGPGGEAAAALAALTPALIAEGHLMKPHVPGCVPVLLCLLASLRILDQKDRAWSPYLLAGAAAGAAMSFNPIYASFCGLSIAFAHLAPCITEPRSIKARALDLRFWTALALFASVYVITNPYALLSYHEYKEEIVGYNLGTYRFGHLGGILGFWLYPLRIGGSVLWAWALPACAAALAWGERRDRYLVMVTLCTSIYFGLQLGSFAATTPEFVRYFLPGFFLLALLAVRSVGLLATRLRWPPLRPLGLAALLAASVPAGAAEWLDHVRDVPKTATDCAAGNWINENLPKGSRIAIFQEIPHVYSEPPFRFGDYRLFSLSPFFKDPHFTPTEPLPEYAVWGVYYGTFAKGDPQTQLELLENLGYEPIQEFRRSAGREDLLDTAGMPYVVYHLATAQSGRSPGDRS